MKVPVFIAFVFAIFLMLNLALAQEAAQPAPSQVPVVGAAPVVEAPSPIEAPPSWLVDALKMVASLPVIGPLVAKVLQWLGVLSVILTSLVAFLLASIQLLKSVSTWAGFDKVVLALQSFEQSSIMYWLKWASMFNAKPPGFKK